MSTEQQLINDYENTPGKPEGKIDLPSDNTEPTSSKPVSASDKAQADIKSLRGEYGQGAGTTSDAQSKYDQLKGEQLKGEYGQSGKQSDSTPATSESTDDIKS